MHDPSLRFRPLWLTIGFALLALIIYLSLTPAPIQIDTGLDWQDKLFHTFAYLALMGWFMQIYHATGSKLLLAVCFAAVGVAMEFIQAMTPERYFEYADMVANTLGVIVGYLLSLTPLRFTLQRFEQLFLNR